MLSRTIFYRKLKSIVGLTPVDFIREIRIKRAVQLIDSDEYNFSQVAYMTGFNDPKYFSKCFKKVINLAIANEWLTKNPFAGIKFHEVEVNKQFLSQAEINRIWQKEFRIERLELVRDVFTRGHVRGTCYAEYREFLKRYTTIRFG